jgi:hypothetical protein
MGATAVGPVSGDSRRMGVTAVGPVSGGPRRMGAVDRGSAAGGPRGLGVADGPGPARSIGVPPRQRDRRPVGDIEDDLARRATRRNPWAVVALVGAIVPLVLPGIMLGVIGVLQAGRAGRGRAMSWFAIMLSVLWVAVYVIVTPLVLREFDPGCRETRAVLSGPAQQRLGGREDPDAFQADLNEVIAGLRSGASGTKLPEAKKAINAYANDLQQIADGIKNGVPPTAALSAALTRDAAAVDVACHA